LNHWRRTRTISFRVSDHEFELLKTRSLAEGARSVSDFARLALCGSHRNLARLPGDDLDHLQDQLQALSAHVQRLAETLERKGPVIPQRSLAAVGRKAGGT
jgi:transposase